MLINIDRGNGIEQMDESLLSRHSGTSENDNEVVKWVEYHLDGQIVHRSAHVHLKKGLDLTGFQGNFS